MKLKRLSRSWSALAAAVWLFIIAYQWYRFTVPIWYEETSELVLLTLIITAAAEFLPIGSLLRWLVKLGGIAFIHFRIIRIHDMVVTDGMSFLDELAQFREHMLPYIWFSLATWALFELSIRIVDRRRPILMFLGLNLVAFAILDSYTPYHLWTETAWTFAAGMGWLVTSHLRKVKMEHPKGWLTIKRNPLRIILNTVVLIAVVVWVGVSVPAIHPILEDPYTVYTRLTDQDADNPSISKNGDSSKGNGKGEGDGSSAKSGYSRDDSHLGGGFQFDSSPVMNITTTERAYWRGETRDYYTGTGWIEDTKDTAAFQEVRNGDAVINPAPGSLERHQVVQQVTMATEQRYPVLFGAYSIQNVTVKPPEDVAGMSPQLIWRIENNEMLWKGFASSNGGASLYPESYTVTSEVPVIEEDKLEQLTFEELNRYRDEKKEDLQVPTTLPERTRRLAKEITASSKTPYGKVMLLQNYLTQNFAYTNTPDLSKQQSSDFVDSFLFEIKQGYCDYFSTAFVIMARSLDIPTRWVKGYSSGQLSSSNLPSQAAPEGQNRSTGPQTYLVTNANAHSWAEVYMGSQYGWIPVEATPGFSLPSYESTEIQPSEPEPEQPEEEQPSEPVSTPKQEEAKSSFPMKIVAWSAGLIILAWLSGVLWVRRDRLYFGLLKLKTGRKLTAADKVVAEARRWQSLMRHEGYERGSHETLRETVLRWSAERPELDAKLQTLLQQFEQAKYSSLSVGEEDWKETRRLTRELKQILRNKTPKRGA